MAALHDLQIFLLQILEHFIGHLFCHLCPNIDDFVVSLTIRDQAFPILALHLNHGLACLFHQRLFHLRDMHIVNPD